MLPNVPLWAAALLVVPATVIAYGALHLAAEAARPYVARFDRWRRVRRVRRAGGA